MEIANKALGSKALAMLMVASVLTAGVVVDVPKAEAATPNAESDFTVTTVAGGVEISKYIGVSKDVVVPATIGGKDVVSIGESSFSGKGLTKVELPDSIHSIGKTALWGNQITSIKLPESLVNIGEQALSTNKLTTITFPGTLTSIGKMALYENVLTSVDIPNSVTTIGDSAFANNQITSAKLPVNLTNIPGGMFAKNKLTTITIPTSVVSIGDSAFSTNELTSVVIPVGVTSIGGFTFHKNLLTSLALPDSVTSVGSHAFSYNTLANVIIPDNVKTIDTEAFTSNQVVPANLTIWGVDPSAAKMHALAKGYTFNIKVPDPVVPDPTPGEGDSQTATLNLEGGDLTLETSEIQDFGSIKLKNQPQTVTTGFDDKFTVTDNRGTGLGWRLDVSATQFSEVVPVGGFAGGAPTGFTLPIGSLMINGLDTIERTGGTPGGNPSIAGLSNTVIDGSSLATVSNAGLNEGAGKFALTFGEEALSLVVDSSTAKVDTLNYPTGATPYESTVTWDLVSAP